MASGVDFEEDNMNFGSRPRQQGVPNFGGGPRYATSNTQPKMVRFLMRHGLAKSPAMAQSMLVGLIVVNIILIYVVLKYI